MYKTNLAEALYYNIYGYIYYAFKLVFHHLPFSNSSSETILRKKMETFTGNSSSKLKYLTIMMIIVHFHLVYLQICNYIETVISHKTRQHQH